MSLTVGIFATKMSVRADHIFAAFERGLREHGDIAVHLSSAVQIRSVVDAIDVGVQICFPNRFKAGEDFRWQVNVAMREAGKRVVTIDTGFVRNQSDLERLAARAAEKRGEAYVPFASIESVPDWVQDAMYEVGYDGLKGHADYCVTDPAPSDRWEALATPLRPRANAGPRGHILILGQTPRGMSSQHADIYEVYRRWLKTIGERCPDRPIVFRHHPRISKLRPKGGSARNRVDKDLAHLRKLPGYDKLLFSTQRTLEDDLIGAHCAVGFTSNATVVPPLMGIPIIATDPGSMAYSIAEHSINHVANPHFPGESERSSWAHRLAYCQWSPRDMASGACWAHLRPHATKPRSDTDRMGF